MRPSTRENSPMSRNGTAATAPGRVGHSTSAAPGKRVTSPRPAFSQARKLSEAEDEIKWKIADKPKAISREPAQASRPC